MQIFLLDEDLEVNAQYYGTKHITKIPTEVAQLLSTAVHNQTKLPITNLYKPYNKGSRFVLWAMESRQNFEYMIELGIALCNEYTYRYNKTHGALRIMNECKKYISRFPEGERTTFAMAVPKQYIRSTVVESYRTYYAIDKYKMHHWKDRPIPPFIYEY